MLRLKNVSKFYYNKGVIASGFSKLNINFSIGEFVVITGESGSGKSTLLNVISGLDTYEEGEMYIDGVETSHYTQNDFFEYRKKYVSNIFQNFNLVNSYTVYQNIELVLLINGYSKREVKNRVLDLIKMVKLTKYKNTKVSKLSGGQKQRVAIARALAKETPIIVCDEPTANLDSKSSMEVIEILKEVSRDKLVILVTHDYPLVEHVATRVVKMHDGKIASDKRLVDCEDSNKEIVLSVKDRNIGLFNIIRLGFRNTFNIVSKFILLFIVFLFITVSLLTEYGSMRKSEYESSKLGFNYYFSDTSDTRIIIKKKDGSSISNSDFNEIRKLDNVSFVEENDILLDNYLWLETDYDKDSDGYFINGLFKSIDRFDLDLDYGRMPIADNEVVILVNAYDFVSIDELSDVLKYTYYVNGDTNGIGIKIVGVKYIAEDVFIFQDNVIYGNKLVLDEFLNYMNIVNSDIVVNINNFNYKGIDDQSFLVFPSNKIKSGNVYVHENISYACKDFNCKNRDLSVSINNIYYSDSINLKISNVYNDKNVNNLLGISKDNNKYGAIFISGDDYNKLFNSNIYQSSVFANKVTNVDELVLNLEDMGYDTLEMRKTLNSEGKDTLKILKIIKLVVTVILVITLFFISYFVINLILKSRNVYFSTLRILGTSIKDTKKILDIELFINSSLAYMCYLIFILLVRYNIINIRFINSILEYLSIKDYIFMYIILVVMSYLISQRFSSKIFKKSMMSSYREEV